jgi:hypothetical protein
MTQLKGSFSLIVALSGVLLLPLIRTAWQADDTYAA